MLEMMDDRYRSFRVRYWLGICVIHLQKKEAWHAGSKRYIEQKHCEALCKEVLGTTGCYRTFHKSQRMTDTLYARGLDLSSVQIIM